MLDLSFRSSGFPQSRYVDFRRASCEPYAESQGRRQHLVGLTSGAIPGGFGQAGNNRIPRVIIGGGIGDECGHGQVLAIGQSDNADVVSRGGDWLALASPTSPYN